ncbi:glutamine synthetase family protein [Dongia sedimenti]|uniref:Glutamine synthetase family protein n=1 Tax=Dongia sedimenti TaxID=3064282 RepID=A0ABU0YRJ2_9PROT|nr:glutamine synthetase family protein [Rhodospirillaceae bacterium R-7]
MAARPKNAKQPPAEAPTLREPLTMFCYADLTGAVRGKGFPTRMLGKKLKSGVGWTPTNIMFTALGTIAPSPWGPHGDLSLMPDPATKVEVDFGDGSAAERFFLCDVRNTDGSAWDCCPRTFLKDAVAALEKETGLHLMATFEQEFVYSGANERVGDNYALDAIRRHGNFGETYLGALREAGIEPDSYLAEYAAGQFEVTLPPRDALAACDTAIIVRELARATAWRLGHRVTFSPRVTPDGLGSGVHIHFSLWDKKGKPVSHDPKGELGISEKAGQFLAGVIEHMPALCAFTAPTPVSYLRLKPHTWTGAWSNLGYRDREAGIRICPTFGSGPDAVARQFNFEYRAADATANAYLQLGMIIHAGLAGLKKRLPMPKPTKDQDPETMSEAERAKHKIRRLPGSTTEAFAALKSDKTVQAFLPKQLLEIYIAGHEAEFALSEAWSPAEICRRYVEVY